MTSTASTGPGNPPTAPWGRPVWGGSRGPEPDGPRQKGYKRSILVDANGGPLGVTIAGANVHDTKLLRATLEAMVVPRPPVASEHPQHLCLDKGYDNPTGHQTAASFSYDAHIRRIGEEKLDCQKRKTQPARRWVVERAISWMNKCRGLLVRYEKKASNYLAQIQLCCALIWFRRSVRLEF